MVLGVGVEVVLVVVEVVVDFCVVELQLCYCFEVVCY